MSLTSFSKSHNVPFFPPGIANHKVRRPQSVKECKKLSQKQLESMLNRINASNNYSQGKKYNNCSNIKRLSASIPNIKVCGTSSDQVSPIPKHNCDMGLTDYNTFKATPLPRYYSPDSLERNRSLFENLDQNYQSRSLDRIPTKALSMDRISMKNRSKNRTNFVPDKPFYPPSQYPNIHDQANVNLQRLLETREQYKTPQSRKSLVHKSKSMSKGNRPKDLSMKTSKMGGSVPNLNSRNSGNISNSVHSKESMKKSTNNDLKTKNPVDYTPEIGLYRHNNKLDFHDEFDSSENRQMSASYYYPKPIPNQFYNDYDKMVQSLYNESSLAAKIQTGSLERATRNPCQTKEANKVEVTDLDDSPSKSYSPVKACNSFSQDSLDGTKRHRKADVQVFIDKQDSETIDSSIDAEKSYNSNLEDNSINSETKTYRFQSESEDDRSLIKEKAGYNHENESVPIDHYRYNKFNNNANENDHNYQVSPSLYGITTSRFQHINDADFSSVKTEIENPLNHSLSTISEKERSSEDQNKSTLLDQISLEQYNVSKENLFNETPSGINSIPITSYNNFLDSNHCFDNTSQTIDSSTRKNYGLIDTNNAIPDQENNRFLDQYNSDRFLNSNSVLQEVNKSSSLVTLASLSINNEFLESKTYKFKSPTEDDVSSIKMDNQNKKSSLLDQYNIDRYLTSIPNSNQLRGNNFISSSNALSIHNEFLDKNVPTNKIDDQWLLDNIASKSIVSSEQKIETTPHFKRNEYCSCEDRFLTSHSCNKFPVPFPDQKSQDIDSVISTVYSSINTQVSGLDYDLAEMGISNNIRPYEHGGKQLPPPKILFQSDATKSVEDSSESESSLSGSDDTSFMKYEYNSVHTSRAGVPWLSSPELTVARSDIVTRRHRRHLQSENPLKPLCNVCFKPAYFMERISINNIIFHKRCFLCKKCDTHLSFNNCIIHRRKPYCIVHAKSKIWKIKRSVSASKLNQIKERLDSKSNLQKQSSTELKQPKRVFYGGIKSAKDRFLQENASVPAPVVRQQKRFTPPRQGVTAGVIESEPKPRDPNIVTGDDNVNRYSEDLSRVSQSSSTKEKLARFKEIEGKSFDKQNITNGDDGGYQKPNVIGVDTKILRNKFLSGMNDADSDSKPRKLNPSEEIQELTRKESNSVYENEPEVRHDVIKSDSQFDDENVPFAKNKAKELKEMFTNYSSEDRSKKTEKFQMEIGEGGIYESNPQERDDDVIPYKSEKDFTLPNNTVKSGLQKIKDLQNLKSQGYQKTNTEPIKLDCDTTHSGIYENNPAESQADSVSNQNDEYLADIRVKNYTNDAKRVFLEKQKQEEESKSKRDTPQMIDIWKDLCPDSGVFENKPKAQDKDVVRHVDLMLEHLAVGEENGELHPDEEDNTDETR